MKHFYTSIALIVFSLIFAGDALAQFKLTGEVRPRPEMFDHGYKSLADENSDANWVTSQRTRIYTDFAHDYVKFRVTFQDIRNWGDTKTLNTTDPYLSIHEAWGEIMFTENFSLKLGRQELVYDDHRIFGSVAWAQQARSHDVGLFKYEDGFKLHVGLGFNKYKTGNASDAAGFFRAMQFAWFNKDFDFMELSALFLNHGTQLVNFAGQLQRETRYSQTAGFYAKSDLGPLSLNGFFYYQMGQDSRDRTIKAYDASLNASLKLIGDFSLIAGFEMLSGTNFDTDDSYNYSFNPFYGTNHKFNGLMDYFYVGNHIDNVGLNDFNAGFKWKNGKWNAEILGHYFMSNATIQDPDNPGTAADAALGTEIDFTAGYKLNEWITFSGGYSQLFATESMEYLKGGSKDVTNNWAFVMITIKPVLYSTSK